jgi:hypothetical protein
MNYKKRWFMMLKQRENNSNISQGILSKDKLYLPHYEWAPKLLNLAIQ